ncbi:gephyrin-like molybdotransferase Glp [Methylocaldum sp.]|uniref:molybdopterin molybdotransferase MoeA n=1 Tax=Methylocaldum sp. TaxID=1969727 RepID=UPI002D44A3D0|nr:gephyrin-like molybdotransferase Glp [Methylocaldum sp.]HYE36831.1 gephyrin-like molybdotransferase Glp [Methylocaldum sp.]
MREPDCCAEKQPQPLPLKEALDRIFKIITPARGTEQLPLKQALGRILAEDVYSTIDLPPFPNSAMDGYAVRTGDLRKASKLRVIGTAWAGQPFSAPLSPGECVRILTGAALPENADAVLMQEHARREGDHIQVAAEPKPGEHIRPRGEELKAGDRLLSEGEYLGPAEIGLLASIGMPAVSVRRKLRVAFFSTGDELRAITEPLAFGEIHDSNRYVLDALLTGLGIETIDMGVIRDDKDAIRRALLEASDQADAVISAGGASVGDADFITEVTREIGHIDFWKVAIKPGKPFAFGRINSSFFFGLPGNPVSMTVTFQQLARPALLRLMGAPIIEPLRLKAVCTNRLYKLPGRLEFQRGVYHCTPNGGYTVTGLTCQGASQMTSLSLANCFIILPTENSGIEAGQTVEIEPFHTSY